VPELTETTVDRGFLDEGASVLRQSAQIGTPSEAAKTTASNRLASRLAANNASNEEQIRNLFAARGRGRSGALKTGLIQNLANTQQATASGIADIEEDFENRKLQQGQLLNQVGQTFGSFGNVLNQANLAKGRLDLDTERVGLEEQALGQSAERDKLRGLLDFFGTFIEGGNLSAGGRTPARDEQFNNQLNQILERLFGATA
jgi:hypothetical protein